MSDRPGNPESADTRRRVEPLVIVTPLRLLHPRRLDHGLRSQKGSAPRGIRGSQAPQVIGEQLGQQVQSRYAPGSATTVIPSVPALERTSNEKPTLTGFTAMGCSPAPCDGR